MITILPGLLHQLIVWQQMLYHISASSVVLLYKNHTDSLGTTPQQSPADIPKQSLQRLSILHQ